MSSVCACGCVVLMKPNVRLLDLLRFRVLGWVLCFLQSNVIVSDVLCL